MTSWKKWIFFQYRLFPIFAAISIGLLTIVDESEIDIDEMNKDKVRWLWVRTAVIWGALVWWIYGIVETVFSVAVPNIRLALSSVFPDLLAAVGIPRVVGTFQTVVLLLVYLVIGSLLGALQAGIAWWIAGRRVREADPVVFWSAAATMTLVVLFVLNALAVGEALVIPAAFLPFGLSVLRLSTAWNPTSRASWRRLTHPLIAIVILSGSAFLMQPRPELGQAIVYAFGTAYGFAVILAAWAATRSMREKQPLGVAGHWPTKCWVAVALISLLAVVATWPQDPGQRPLRRPAAPVRPGDRRPNVILITWDTVRADHLSLYGYGRDTTPFLRELERQNATIYTRAIAPANWTLPTHASIFTGLNPRRHCAHYDARFLVPLPISEKVETLAEILSREGYRTGGIVANSHVLVPAFGFDRGFSYYDCRPLSWPFSEEPRRYLLREVVRVLAANLLPGKSPESKFFNAEEINERVGRFMKPAAGSRQPFFLFINYMDAHAPYVPPHPFAGRFSGRDKLFCWSNATKRSDKTGCLLRPLSARELQHLTSQYDGAIAYLDDRLRRLFATLRELDLDQESLIIVTADHGEAFGEGGMVGHGVSLYQHQIHVPLIVKFPHPSPGGRVDVPVSVTDLFPTILDVVHARAPLTPDGQSLLTCQSGEPRWICSESDWEPKGIRDPGADRPRQVAIISGTFKAIYGRDGSSEVYDLAADPSEMRNVQAMRQLPAEWFARLTAYLGSEGPGPPVSKRLDPETIRRLRALGYLN
jgi:arylsulfatase A-like enzyme